MKKYILKTSKIIICISIVLGVVGVVQYAVNEPIVGETAISNCEHYGFNL